MYTPKVFEQPDIALMHSLMREYPFATLVVTTSDGLEANHLPLLLRDDGSEYGILAGHLARANPLWKQLAGVHALVIFHGPDAYISPSWYPTKREHGKVVPTWNYAVVHIRGNVRVVEDIHWLHQLLGELTNTHEASFNQPWSIADAPADYIEKLTNAVVGIEIPITSLQGKWKLSQNQPEGNHAGVIDGLNTSANKQHHVLAELMGQK